MEYVDIEQLKGNIHDLKERILDYFNGCKEDLKSLAEYSYSDSDFYWNELSSGLQESGLKLKKEITNQIATLAEVVKYSVLTNDADVNDLKISVKKIRSALMLRGYWYSPTDAIYDDGVVLGVSPASQEESISLDPIDAQKVFE